MRQQLVGTISKFADIAVNAQPSLTTFVFFFKGYSCPSRRQSRCRGVVSRIGRETCPAPIVLKVIQVHTICQGCYHYSDRCSLKTLPEDIGTIKVSAKLSNGANNVHCYWIQI